MSYLRWLFRHACGCTSWKTQSHWTFLCACYASCKYHIWPTDETVSEEAPLRSDLFPVLAYFEYALIVLCSLVVAHLASPSNAIHHMMRVPWPERRDASLGLSSLCLQYRYAPPLHRSLPSFPS